MKRVSTNPCFRNLLSALALCPPPWTPAPWECIPPSGPESLERILATDEPHHCVRGFSSALQLNVIPFAQMLTRPNPSGITFPLECECPSLSASRNTSQVGWHLPASSILTWKVGFQRQSLLTLKGGVHHLVYEAGFLPRRPLTCLTGVRPLPPPLTNNHFP